MSGRHFLVVFLFLALPPAVSATSYVSPSSHTAESALWGEHETSVETAASASDNRREDIPVQKNPPLWLEHAVPEPEAEEDTPMIAIVIDDLGINRKMTEAVLKLPAPITTAFLAYAENLPEQTERARKNGHELLMHIPMEPVNPHFDPGPNTLLTKMTGGEISERLNAMLSSFDGYVGINNHMGSRFSADKAAIGAVIDELKKRGLIFLDSMTSGNSSGWKSARDRNVPYAVRDIFLDNAHDENEIMKQLDLVEKQALKHHVAVAIGHPHATTVNALKKWIPKATEKGFVFIPVSLVALIGQEKY